MLFIRTFDGVFDFARLCKALFIGICDSAQVSELVMLRNAPRFGNLFFATPSIENIDAEKRCVDLVTFFLVV